MQTSRWRGALAGLGLLAGLAGTARGGVWPTEVDRLARQLEAPDLAERRAAAGRLSALPSHLVGALVTRALEDPDLDVRLAAAGALLAHRSAPPEDVILPWLSDPEPRLRLAACQVLRQGPSPKAVPALARVLADNDPRVRQAAAAALGNAGVPDAVGALLGHLDDGAPEVRVAVVDALWRLGDARAVIPLVGKAQDSAPEVRRSVVRALGELGDRRAATALVLALRDGQNEVKIDALNALGALGEPTSVLAIAPLIDPQTPAETRRAALGALARIGGPRALGLLAGALEKDEQGAGLAPARDALVRMGPPAVPTLLATLAAPPSERAAAFAAEALGLLRASEAREPITQAMRKGVLPATSGLRALGALGDLDALPVALELLTDRSPAVRAEARRAAEALLDGRQPRGVAVDPIAAALADVKLPADERSALLRLLGRTRSPRAAKIVGPLVSVPALRLAAVDALGALGDAADAAPLLAALDDDDPVLRAHAGAALGRVAGEATVLDLLGRAGSSAQQDREALATALAGALGRASGAAVMAQVETLLGAADGAMRDALIEGLGRMKTDAARGMLERLALSREIGDRRKVAEALAGHPAARGALRGLLADFDAGVRAGTAWSLGRIGEASDLPALGVALADPNTAVAANAAVALGLVAARGGSPEPARKALCPLLRDGRSYVRAGALEGLLAARARCGTDGEIEQRLLSQDPSPIARAAAADLLLGSPAKAAERDLRALSRCRLEDTRGSVASRCAAAAPVIAGAEPVAVLVVLDGQTKPAPEAPFALGLADRSIRHGVTDRRGGVFEVAAPKGSVALEVPAPFVR
jgi:HEAT repeat protein